MHNDVQRCRTCRFWDSEQATLGQCRKQPPTPMYGWPQTNAVDWCGSWQGRPPKLTAESVKALQQPGAVGVVKYEHGDTFTSCPGLP